MLKREIENEKREALLKVKDEIYKKRTEFEIDMKRERVELERLQSKINAKYETIEKKEQELDELNENCNKKNVIYHALKILFVLMKIRLNIYIMILIPN